MKKLRNPTTYFFEQAENTPDLYSDQIKKLVDQLLNKDICPLCRKDYNTKNRVPRIMIHCGHTFCTHCLAQFYINRRVRCPMCLKLVKQLDSLERLPINHTIYAYLIKKQRQQALKSGQIPEIVNANQFLFGEFQRVQKEAHLRQNPPKYDNDSGLPFCVFHNDRVEHFFCEGHKTFGCRVCIEVGHSHSECQITDLYTVDQGKYLEFQTMMGLGDQRGISDSNIGRFNLLGGEFNLNDDGNLIDDDSDSDEQEHKSV